jgi:hypothetical protein
MDILNICMGILNKCSRHDIKNKGFGVHAAPTATIVGVFSVGHALVKTDSVITLTLFFAATVRVPGLAKRFSSAALSIIPTHDSDSFFFLSSF